MEICIPKSQNTEWSKCPWVEKEIRKLCYTHLIDITGPLKEGAPITCDNLDEAVGHYIVWNVPDTERHST